MLPWLHEIDGFFDIKITQTQDANAQHKTDDSADPDDSIIMIPIPKKVPVMPVKVGIVEPLIRNEFPTYYAVCVCVCVCVCVSKRWKYNNFSIFHIM